MMMPENSAVLLPEILQRIAVFSTSSKDMLAFLRAFPQILLSEPLQALLELFNAHYQQRLALPKNEVYVRLWPEFQLPDEVQDQKLLACIEKAMALVPAIDITDVDTPPKLPLAVDTKVKIHRLRSMQQIDRAMKLWHHRIQSLNLWLENVSSTDMNRICQALTTMPSLEKLDISLSNIPTIHHQDLVHALYKSNIKSLTLRCYLSKVEWNYTITSLFASWITEKSVASIDLDRISFSDECAEIFFEALLASSTLKHLSIGGFWKSQFLAKSRVLPQSLESLEFESFTNQDLTCLASFLKHSKLQYLSISNDPEMEENISNPTKFWTTTLPTMSHLRQLIIEGYVLNHVACESISFLLPNLVNLHLEGNELDDTEFDIIAKVIPQCNRLERLCVAFQNITYLSAMALAQVIPQCKSLKSLDIGDNRIGSIGVYALCPVLKYLDKVDFSENGIGFDGAIAISQVLHETEHMLSLRLVDNMLQLQGVLHIMQALSTSKFRAGVVDLSSTLPDGDNEICRLALHRLPDKSWCILEPSERIDFDALWQTVEQHE